MLVLTIAEGDEILIGPNVKIKVGKRKGRSHRIAIDAPGLGITRIPSKYNLAKEKEDDVHAET